MISGCIGQTHTFLCWSSLISGWVAALIFGGVSVRYPGSQYWVVKYTIRLAIPSSVTPTAIFFAIRIIKLPVTDGLLDILWGGTP